MLHRGDSLPKDRKVLIEEREDWGRFETFLYKGHIFKAYISYRTDHGGGAYSCGYSNKITKWELWVA